MVGKGQSKRILLQQISMSFGGRAVADINEKRDARSDLLTQVTYGLKVEVPNRDSDPAFFNMLTILNHLFGENHV